MVAVRCEASCVLIDGTVHEYGQIALQIDLYTLRLDTGHVRYGCRPPSWLIDSLIAACQSIRCIELLRSVFR